MLCKRRRLHFSGKRANATWNVPHPCILVIFLLTTSSDIKKLPFPKRAQTYGKRRDSNMIATALSRFDRCFNRAFLTDARIATRFGACSTRMLLL